MYSRAVFVVVLSLSLMASLTASPAEAGQVGQLDLRIYTPLPNENLITPRDQVVDPDEVDLEDRDGGYAFTNIDDDNDSTAFDDSETDIEGENDPIRIQLIARCVRPQPCTAKVELSAPSGVDKIRIWEDRRKLGPVTLPATFAGASIDKTLFVEGINSSTALRDVELKLRPLNFVADPDSVKVTVLRVHSVMFRGKDNNLEGDKVFPEAQTPSGPVRDKVEVVVKLNVPPPLEAVNIFLKSFDVDDPSASGDAVDPNDDLPDGLRGDYRDADGSGQYLASVRPGTYLAETLVCYSEHEDNRGSFFDAFETECHDEGEIEQQRKNGILDGEDASMIAQLMFPKLEGEKKTEFRVTMQPGDNFRVVASHDRAFLPGLRNRDRTDATNIYDHSVNGLVPDHDDRVSDVLTVWRNLHLEVDAMRAPIRRRGEFSGAGVGNDDVGPGQPGSETIFDADRSVQKPDVSLLEAAFRDACIRPVDDLEGAGGSDTTDDTTFHHNVEPDTAAVVVGEAARDVASTPAFWVAHILGAYEGGVAEDGDPDTQGATLGFTARTPDEHRSFVQIYQETIRDGHAVVSPTGTTVAQAEQRVVIHEVGHEFELTEDSGAVMTGNFVADNPNYPFEALTFTRAHLSAIRSIDAP